MPSAPVSPPTPDTGPDAQFASRGGLKLLAAIEQFGLAPAVQGARCIDVGASTGGFTDCLLRHGAAEVVALDVGHGQMVQSLREDPRVVVLEHTHIKLAPLRIAPGPFTFFTVDVSFMAARSTLRPLAFRLAPSALGVVLVKPQFELPKELVPKGGVRESEALCKFALNRFKKKAASLHFAVVSWILSPIAGGKGDLEVLAQVRFDGPAPATNRVEEPG
jgi:23S rRNA (cytidine1920-2'-O)/16S rRNA (cytidine1409-2'-O)-methyltransferase